MSVFSSFGDDVLRAVRERRLSDAERLLRDALDASKQQGHGRVVVQAYRALADVASQRDDRAAALGLYREAVHVARTLDAPRVLAHTVRHEGDLLRRAGRFADAWSRYEEALGLYRDHAGTPPGELANAVRPAALTLEALGEPSGAAALWREARDLYAEVDLTEGAEEAEAALARLTDTRAGP